MFLTTKSNVVKTCVPVFGFSDHFPVCLTWLKKRVKILKSGHKTITYRCFSKFDDDSFPLDLSNSTILGVYNFCEPDATLQHGMRPSSVSTSMLPLKLYE